MNAKRVATTIDAKPEEALRVPTDDRGVRWVGLIILLIFFGGFGGWSATAELSSAAVAPGVVAVESHRKTIQHLEGGIVQDLLVRDGDVVESQQVLLRLDDTQDRAQLEVARLQLMEALALEARLLAEREEQDTLGFPEELEEFRGDPRLDKSLKGHRQVLAARRATLLGETALLEQRIGQLKERIRGLEGLARTKKRRIDSLNAEVAELNRLFKAGHIEKTRMLALEREAAEVEGERAQHLADITSTELQISETQMEILQLTKRIQREVEEELRTVQAEVFDLRERIRALDDRVMRTEIRAPEEGIVMDMGVHTIGGVISPGTRILDIVPRDSELVVEARVNPIDIDNVHSGLKADVRFSAFKARLTPVVEGEVITVSADRYIDDESGQPYYLSRIRVSEAELRRLDNRSLMPGMPAEVMIKTGDHTLLSYLLQPVTDAFARSFRED